MIKSSALIAPEIKEILQGPNASKGLKEFFHEMHPYDIFVLCEDLEDDEIAECIRGLGIPTGFPKNPDS